MKIKGKKHSLPPATHPHTDHHLLFHNVDPNGYISIKWKFCKFYKQKKKQTNKQKRIIDTQVIFQLQTFMQLALQRIDKTIQ